MNQKVNDFEQAMKNFKNKGNNFFSGGPSKSSKFIFVIIGVILLIWGLYSSYYTVEPDEEAVVLRLGRYTTTNPPGLHMKIPFGLDRVFILRTKAVHQLEFGFRTSSVKGRRTEYSNRNLDHESLMLTGDLNVADVEWVVQYQISDPYKYIFKLKSPEENPDQNIRDVSESVMRRVVGDRPVGEILTTGRAEIATEAQLLMQEVLDRYDIGVRVVNIELQDVNPPGPVKDSFNEVNAAKQEQEKMINEAERNYNKVIPEARGKAEERISRTIGYAEALVKRAEGDAGNFNKTLSEYQRAPLITRKRIYLETMGKLFKRFKKITIVDNKIKGILPVYGGASNNILEKK